MVAAAAVNSDILLRRTLHVRRGWCVLIPTMATRTIALDG